MKDWIDVYNCFPKLIGKIVAVMGMVSFVGLFLASSWFIYALVTR